MFNILNFKKMKNLKYVLVFVFGLFMMSCTEDAVTPKGGEDDPIVIPPPPPKK
jgi:hypothetical protein